MKKIGFAVMAFVLVLSTVFIACDNDDDDDNNTVTYYPSMSADVDGIAWNAITRVAVRDMGGFNITGTSLDGKVINLTTLTGDSIGTYVLNPPFSNHCGVIYKPTISSTNNYIGITATISITAVSSAAQRISGTFNFVAQKSVTESVTVTNGTFTDIRYTNQ